ncbi:MAG: polysaccharide deacetylase family protein [Lachnospiraceae bacterium]|nr:polysaccharide deacetylase family protein [Lachnospiraceae bacterium]
MGQENNKKKKRSGSKTLIIIAAEFVIIAVLLIVMSIGRPGKNKNTGTLTPAGGTGKVAQSPAAQSADAGKNTAQQNADELLVASTGQVPAGSAEDGSEKSAAAVAKAREEEEELIKAALKAHEDEVAAVIATADRQAAMYDYDKAMDTIRAYEGYEQEESMTKAIASYEEQKAACVVWHDNTQISHVFFHSLIYDTSKSFGPGSSQPLGYNRYMTTVSEFNKMMESMYEKGFVLVSIHDIAKIEKQADGSEKFVAQPIYLPEGKEPFVLSQDDVNYYLYMEGDGFAEKLVIGEDGRPTCMYINDDGSVSYGEYDVLPIIDRFVDEHPDFSYRGAKGILAVTGFEGALGYDTGLSMKKYDGMSEDEKMKLINAEREEAKKVADAIKADGWEFASHSYTHTNMTTNSADKVKYDTRRWKEEVEIILGPTDIYIYPFGADICDWRGYSGDKFDILKGAGFDYFCNVDSARAWIQIRDTYFRMGRINLDGERMNKTPEKLTDFFNVEDVYDHSRPELKL